MIDLDDGQDWWAPEQVEKHSKMMSPLHLKDVDVRLRSGAMHVGTIYRRKRNGSTKAEVRFDGLAGCLRTPRGGSAKQIVIAIDRSGLRMRWMSPREYARLQGAPNFKMVQNRNQNLYAFGDAVCVPVIQWIDQCVLTPIYNSYKTRRKLLSA
jgi:DNA (cytosine-5)-methyltransferase 1